MKKRVLSALLCGVMLTGLLTGCGGNDAGDSNAGENDTENVGNAGDTENPNSSTDAPTGEVETIKVYTQCTGTASNYDNVVARINEITSKEIGVEIELTPLDMGQYFQQYFMLLSGGEDIDLISSYYDLAGAAIQQGAFMPLDDLVAEYGTDIQAAFPDGYLDAAKVNGTLYGIPTQHANASVRAFGYNKEITDELNIDMSQVKTFADWGNVMAKVHEAYPDMMCMVSPMGMGTSLENSNMWDNLTDCLGVIMVDDPDTVVNLYETEEFKQLCLTCREWYELGYMQPDMATTTDMFQDLVKVGRAFSTWTNPEVGAEEYYTTLTGVDSGVCEVGTPLITTDGLVTNQWNIPATSKHAEAAIKFINLLETNAEVATLLNYGEEGVNYKVNEDGTYGYVDGENAGNAAFHANYDRILPNYYLVAPWEGDIKDVEEQSKALDARSVLSPAFGFLYDGSKVANEVTACNNVVSQYKDVLGSGSVDVETVLPEFIQALKDAGIDTIVAEKQRQYNEWRANQQ